MGLRPRDVADMAPHSFLAMMEGYQPADKPDMMSRRKMLAMMRQSNGRP